MTKLFLTVSLVFFLLQSYSQSTIIQDRKQIAAVCDTFMKNFSVRNFYGAVQSLKVYSAIDHEQLDTLSYTVERQMGALGPSYGRIIGYDFISEKSIKEYLVKRVYTLKFEHSLLVFNFICYYNNTEWKIVSFDYTHEKDELFK